MPIAGKRCFVFHESMYSALPTKEMLRDTVSIKNAESRKLMWFGHRIAGPETGSRSYPESSIFHSFDATGRPMRRTRCCIVPAPGCDVMCDRVDRTIAQKKRER
jgi:hypothetical protein